MNYLYQYKLTTMNPKELGYHQNLPRKASGCTMTGFGSHPLKQMFRTNMM